MSLVFLLYLISRCAGAGAHMELPFACWKPRVENTLALLCGQLLELMSFSSHLREGEAAASRQMGLEPRLWGCEPLECVCVCV